MQALNKGSCGQEVRELQTRLNCQGARLLVDGWYGSATEQAVAKLQRRAGLVVSGVAGSATLAALRGQRDPRRLDETDLIAAAESLRLPLPCLKAFCETEAQDGGFLPDGRARILLERHIAYRQALKAGLDANRLASRHPELCGPSRGGYQSAPAEWERFRQLAAAAGETVAVESCLWGLFRLPGFYWRELAYADAGEFRLAMERDEASQLEGLVRLLRARPDLLQTLRERRWRAAARIRQGSASLESLYEARLAAAHDRARRLA
ncbi:N-acetylmuramidase family protein [Chromobacterium violaceum]|uniref:N-acetylmuramidase domain-containing protein n=1 Tax=Chromobacterium violaceum TaxID=536 RepID=UPI001E2FFD9D|nr:N-acetylmuramidase family protein [Chromobacterium violaceum]MCD0493727.1 N-acetylmuramidase family protein [Chromobacterium violaceum]